MSPFLFIAAGEPGNKKLSQELQAKQRQIQFKFDTATFSERRNSSANRTERCDALVVSLGVAVVVSFGFLPFSGGRGLFQKSPLYPKQGPKKALLAT